MTGAPLTLIGYASPHTTALGSATPDAEAYAFRTNGCSPIQSYQLLTHVFLPRPDGLITPVNNPDTFRNVAGISYRFLRLLMPWVREHFSTPENVSDVDGVFAQSHNKRLGRFLNSAYEVTILMPKNSNYSFVIDSSSERLRDEKVQQLTLEILGSNSRFKTGKTALKNLQTHLKDCGAIGGTLADEIQHALWSDW